MLIYILLIILSTIIFISHIYVKDEKVNFVTAFVWVLLMTLFVGSQDGIGTDHSNYIAQIESPWVVPSEPFTILVFAIIRSFGISSYAFFYIPMPYSRAYTSFLLDLFLFSKSSAII